MDVLIDNNFVRIRLRQLDETYPEPTTFGECDFTSMFYFILSLVLISFGTFITVPALGSMDHYLFANLGHMWLLGPICICSGMMLGIKSILYLRRKSVIQMMLRQRALLREQTVVEEVGGQLGAQVSTCRGTEMSGSTVTLPPAYDVIMQPEMPPPSYAEAVLLITHDKAQQPHSTQEESNHDKETS